MYSILFILLCGFSPAVMIYIYQAGFTAGPVAYFLALALLLAIDRFCPEGPLKKLQDLFKPKPDWSPDSLGHPVTGEMRCPFCHHKEFLAGPRGGLCQNVFCDNDECREGFNIFPNGQIVDYLGPSSFCIKE